MNVDYFFSKLTYDSRLAKLFYSEGKILTDLVWKETLQELEFAKLDTVFESLKSF